MAGDRIAVGYLRPGTDGSLVVDGDVNLAEYSRFKHGDGAVAARYGAALADAFAATLGPQVTHLKVTSSAFGFVPPAAHSLLAPFATRLRQVTGLDVECFKVDRLTVTNGDYATMPLEQRKQALGAGSLLVDPQVDVTGERVISVDDVRVTGTHEDVMDECLVAAGAGSVQHLYVVDAWQARHNPQTESMMNASSVRTVADLIEIASAATFVPNARFCKRVITLPPADLARFLRAAPIEVTAWVAEAVISDCLDQYPAYAPGCAAFRATAAAVAAGFVTPARQVAA